MAGIYIHVPFCRKACHYCNFHFSTSTALLNDFVQALLKEIDMVTRPGEAAFHIFDTPAGTEQEPVETVYFGGGTPSLLPTEALHAIVDALHQRVGIAPGAEVTLEANPDDITPEKLRQWKAAGINRLSIGVQSFFDEDLLWMNRAHHAAQALYAIEAALHEGFYNITIDLIFGTPALTDLRWQQNVAQAIALGVPHLSCYALTVEPATALQKMIQQKKSPDVDHDRQANQFLLLTDWMENAGYEQYEISNFARPGMRSRHNSAYWQGKKYLGLGPSAHSFNGNARRWNIAHNALYIQALHRNVLPAETEYLTPVQRLNEYVMTSLRTMEGLNLLYVSGSFGEQAAKQIRESMQQYIESGKVKATDQHFQLTRQGKLFADGIAADLFST